MDNINNFIRIKSNSKLKMSPEGDFFRAWVEFLKPVHNLTNREMDVLAAFLKERYELSKAIIDTDVLDEVLMSEGSKRKIREVCNLSPKHFQVIMCKFKQKHVVSNNRIFLNLIPSLSDEGVGLMVYFSFKDEPLVKLDS